MKTWIKSLICISLSFMCLFACVGYALVSDHMNITGTATAAPPFALFITSVDTDGTLGGSATVNNYLYTVVNSTVYLVDNSGSTATLRVAVYNNTLDYYTFKGVHYLEEDLSYDNPNIVFDTVIVQLGQDNKIAPDEYAYIDIVFSYDEYKGNPESLAAVLELHFGLSGEDEGTDYEDYILAFLTNTNGYGLNDTGGKGKTILNAVIDRGILYPDHKFSGGNLKHLIAAVNPKTTQNLTFVYEYVSDTALIVYTYEDHYNAKSYLGQTITVYKTAITRANTSSKWEASSTLSGTAKIALIEKQGEKDIYAIDVNTWVRVLGN